MADVIEADRYVSFAGIDCDANSAKVVEHVMAIINQPEQSNAFWERFKARLAEAEHPNARVSDELCLLCSHVYYIEELFEEHGDEAGLAALKRLEEECC